MQQAVSASKNAVENNYLSAPEDKKLKDAEKKLYWIEQGKIKASEEEKQALVNEIENKKLLDTIRNIDLENACQNILSSECGAARQQLDSAYDSYFEKLQDGFMSYSDAYLGNYAKYYDGYKDISSLSNELAIKETDASRELEAQNTAKEWGVSIETARAFAVAKRLYNTSMQLAASVVGPNSIKGSTGKGTNVNAGKGTVGTNSISGELTGVAQKQLDKKFKHAADFGITTTKKNSETLGQYEAAIKSHMGDSATKSQGTYGFVKDSKVFFNSNTNNVVVLDASGTFVTRFKLTPRTSQYDNYMKNGVLR